MAEHAGRGGAEPPVPLPPRVAGGPRRDGDAEQGDAGVQRQVGRDEKGIPTPVGVPAVVPVGAEDGGGAADGDGQRERRRPETSRYRW
jgi:hypothetical protein